MTQTPLRAVFQRRPFTNAVADKGIGTPGVRLDFIETDLISGAMPAVCDLEFDIGEVTLTDYMACLDLGLPLVGLPIFLNRNFLHNRIWVSARSGIKTPKDLEGRRVGLKSYTQTAPFWNRGILETEFGVDLSKITWVNIEPSHVRGYRNPANVEAAPEGASLMEMLESGVIDAADDPGRPWADRGEEWQPDPEVIRPLVPNGKALAAEWYQRTGVYPALHLIVVKQAALDAHPKLAADLFGAFVRARDAWMQGITNPEVYRQRGRDIVGRDFLPYGVAPNRATLDMACQMAHSQGITSRPFLVSDLFGTKIAALGAMGGAA